ncbi:MAG: trigger factor [Oscillospiraceae bacterium]|nr:trigger factor [Oscillospiraceae bacterium]
MTVKNVEKLEKSRVALEVAVDAEEFEAAVAKAYVKMRGKINVPGFRPGKAPRKMIEKLYGPEVFYSEAVDASFPEAYEKAVVAENLNTIGYPEVEMVGDVSAEGYTFKATVAVYPEVKLGAYKGVSAVKDEVVVSDDDVTGRLNDMAERNARLVSVEREAQLGDTAVIDYEGFLDGVPFEGGKGEDHQLVLGSGSFVPGFEDQVVGMKAGEEKDIDITFPEDYTAELAGKAVVFHVKCKEVKFKELPALDDEFAKDVSEFDTIDELRADTRKQIEDERKKSVDVAFENALMEKVGEGIEADIPEILIEEQCRRFLDEFKSRLAAQGIPYEQYAKMTNMDEAKFMADGRDTAIKQVRMDLAVAKIIEEEKLEASEEEIAAEYKRVGESYGMDVETVKKYLSEGDIRSSVLNGKVISLVVDNAVVEEKPAEEDKPAEQQAESEN